jgi:hypothetical protein
MSLSVSLSAPNCTILSAAFSAAASRTVLCMGMIPTNASKGITPSHSFIGNGLLVGIWPAFPAHLFIQCVDQDIKEVDVRLHEPAWLPTRVTQFSLPMLQPFRFQLVFHVVQDILLVLIQKDGHCKNIPVSHNVPSAAACITDDLRVPTALIPIRTSKAATLGLDSIPATLNVGSALEWVRTL